LAQFSILALGDSPRHAVLIPCFNAPEYAGMPAGLLSFASFVCFIGFIGFIGLVGLIGLTGFIGYACGLTFGPALILSQIPRFLRGTQISFFRQLLVLLVTAALQGTNTYR